MALVWENTVHELRKGLIMIRQHSRECDQKVLFIWHAFVQSEFTMLQNLKNLGVLK